MAESRRIAIIERALEDAMERLAELPTSSRVLVLKGRVLAYQRVLRTWETRPPREEQRTAMVDLVLELNIAVMRAAEDAGAL